MALKVFDLQCENGHVFEGWFSSHDDFHQQQHNGLLTCPLCDSREVVRQVSASRIQTGSRKEESAAPAAAAPQLQAEWLRRLREAVRSADNVGDQFAHEARRIHEGEAPERAIRGTATPAEREALAADGIAAIPVPAMLDDDHLQ